jgi:signal transduction histidine kinase
VAGAIGLSVVVVAITAGTLAMIQLSVARATLFDQLDPVLQGTQDLYVALANQETGVRGFAVTGNRDFLTPYQQGRQREDTAFATLRRLGGLEQRPALTTGLEEIRARAQAWQTEYAEPVIAAVSASGPAGAQVDLIVGKARFDALRVALEHQRNRLTEVRREARDALSSAATTLLVVSIAIGVGLLGLLIASGIWMRRVITTPIERLSGEVRTVATGQFGRQVIGQGPRELVNLGADIDSMRRQIVAKLTTVQALNERLDTQTAELKRSNSDLEQFAYVASHDLQEPLRKVSAFCELLAKRYAGRLDERADQYIHFAVDGSRRMSMLINDLLAFSRVGRSPASRWVTLDCRVLVERAVRNLGDLIDCSGACITHDPLPTVSGEASLLTTVFQNLISNAIKFRSEQPLQIHIGVQLDGDEWLFRVSDNGIGIDPVYAEKIFVIFQRLHSRDAYPGTGIGLALCRKIIEYHRGRIWLDPHTASGSTFCFTLPAIPESPIPTKEATVMIDPVMIDPVMIDPLMIDPETAPAND